MTRCLSSLLAASALFSTTLLGMGLLPSAHAQGYAAPTRTFPGNAQRGELLISGMPVVTLNGQQIRTTPGFRLFDEKNHLVFAHTLQGKKFTVNYVIEDSTKWLHQAWILTPAELATKPPAKH